MDENCSNLTLLKKATKGKGAKEEDARDEVEKAFKKHLFFNFFLNHFKSKKWRRESVLGNIKDRPEEEYFFY